MVMGSGAPHKALRRERNFLLPPGVALPRLDEFGTPSPIRTRHVRSEYFDTPALDLTAADITLWSRTVGDDDGWHLDSPCSDGSRLERRRPIGRRRRLPMSLRATFAQLVDQRPVLPLVGMTTTRLVRQIFDESGRVRLEVVVDHLEARSLGEYAPRRWRQVKVSIDRSEPLATIDAAAAQLTAAGLTPADESTKLPKSLRRGAAAFGINRAGAAPAVLEALSRAYGRFQSCEVPITLDQPEAVHDARVALRQMRSILGVYSDTLRRSGQAALQRELRWASSLLSGPRDLEVLLSLLDELPSEADLHVDPVLHAHLATRLRTRRAEAHAHLLNAMDTPRWDALHERIVSTLVDSEPTRLGMRPARPELHRFARRAERLVERRWRRARADASDLALWHAVRKSAKSARYAHMVVADLPGADQSDRDAVTAWERITDTLGRLQDLSIAQQAWSKADPEILAATSQPVPLPDLRPVTAHRLAEAQASLEAVLSR